MKSVFCNHLLQTRQEANKKEAKCKLQGNNGTNSTVNYSLIKCTYFYGPTYKYAMSLIGRADDARTSCGGHLSFLCQGERVYCKGCLPPLLAIVKDEHENRKFHVTCGR